MLFKIKVFGFLDPRVKEKMLRYIEREDFGVFIEEERNNLFSFDVIDDGFRPEEMWDGLMGNIAGILDIEIQWDFHDRATEEAFGYTANHDRFELYGKKGYFKTFNKTGYSFRSMR